MEKVSRDIQGEKSRKDTANSRKLVSTIGAYLSKSLKGRSQVSAGERLPSGMPRPLQMLHGNEMIGGTIPMETS